MKLTTTTKELLRVANIATKVTNMKGGLAILENVMLYEKEGKIYATAGNDEQQVTTLVEGTCDEPFRTCLNAKKLQDVMVTLPDAPMEAVMKDGLFTISVAKGKYKLPMLSAENYPILPNVENEVTSFDIEATELVGHIRKAQATRSDDELRPLLGGIALDVEDGAVTFAASDGGQLYSFRSARETNGGGRVLVIPSHVVAVVQQSFKIGMVHIAADDARIAFRTDKTSLVCRMIEGRYPNYKAVIPQGNDKVISVNVKDMVTILKRVNVFASDSSHLVALSVEDGKVCVQAEDMDFSLGAKEYVDVNDCSVPEGFRIGMQCLKLINLLGNVNSDNARITFSEPTRAMTILDEDESPLTQLLMPMLLN